MLRRNRSRGPVVRRSNSNGSRPSSDRGVYERSESRPRYGVTLQSYERYLNQAKDALTSGDRVQAEYYYQHADHFLRILNEHREQGEQNHHQATPAQVPPDQPGRSEGGSDNPVKGLDPKKQSDNPVKGLDPKKQAGKPQRRPSRRPQPRGEKAGTSPQTTQTQE
jgi:Domain of unknown function (DUF4167)